MGVNSECDSQHCCFGSYLIDLAIKYIKCPIGLKTEY